MPTDTQIATRVRVGNVCGDGKEEGLVTGSDVSDDYGRGQLNSS